VEARAGSDFDPGNRCVQREKGQAAIGRLLDERQPPAHAPILPGR
jgi:hypothetical protein